jgi:hypothetical protein
MKAHWLRLAGTFLLGSTLLSFNVAAQTAPSIGQTVVVETPRDAWQNRRAQTIAVIRTLQDENADKAQREEARKSFDATLTRFEKDSFSVTPMEAMDLFQVFYVPNEPGKMEGLLRLVAIQATLGWYDALRFADESGRAEIVNNEAFFKRALLARKDEFIEFLEKEPAKAASSVTQAIQIARRASQSDAVLHYDVRWPASYGLLRMQCGLQASKKCPKPVELSKKDWPAAFEEAAARVTRYYRVNKE